MCQFQRFHGIVREVAVKLFQYAVYLIITCFREGFAEIFLSHFSAIAENVKKEEIAEVGENVKHAERQVCGTVYEHISEFAEKAFHSATSPLISSPSPSVSSRRTGMMQLSFAASLPSGITTLR